MIKQTKLPLQFESQEQALMWLRKLQGMDLEENVAKHGSTVLKRVSLLKIEIVQLEVVEV